MVNVVIADDEFPAVEALAYLLSRDPRIENIYKAMSGAEALRALENHDVDALFLDIHMPALSGLDIARVISRFSRPPAVVFVTADEDQALQAFELAAVDYLLKPVRPERLAESVRRICELIEDGDTKPEVITVDQAFSLQASATQRDRIELSWAIADGYYMYRERMSFAACLFILRASAASPAPAAIMPVDSA